MEIMTDYENYANKIGNRQAIYHAVQEAYEVKSALYPGSHIDIAPSLFIPKVTYIDNFKGAIKFFAGMDQIKAYIDEHKHYNEETVIEFIGEDYRHIDLEGKYDLIISQYAGFVGQATKHYLKEGGHLLCNDSHGDATLSYLDDDFEFIGIISEENKIISSNKDRYFKFKTDRPIDVDQVTKSMKGPKYVYQNENYLFRKKAL